MNIQTVADNLRNTIAGKERMLAEYNNPSFSATHRLVKEAMVQYLELNIDELKRILADVEVCVDQFEKLKKENSDMGWQINPDRMGQ
jgi:SMC interacting uncharacterized protein involved in chromosome segregation